MGNRVTIEMSSAAFEKHLMFYGHWSGEDALPAIKDVLATTDRIGDAGYLAAQIFYRFTQLGGYDGNLGFGIYVGDNDDQWDDNPTHFVDLDTGYYSVGGDDWFDHLGNPIGATNE